MLPAFVIGLREGLEAALIVGIIGAFLSGAGARWALRPVALGVAAAVLLSLAAGAALKVADANLPQRQQEAFETVVALVAVGVITWMIVWMRRHAPTLRETLQRDAKAALVTGSAAALVGMAFFAVLREGLETAVFLLAAFSSSIDPWLTGLGAVLGILVAVALGYGIFRGGVRLDLAHTAHEAGWLNVLQGETLDLSSIVAPGTVRGAVLTGMLGLQPQPVVAEVLAWALYVAVMLPVVLVPASLVRRVRAARQGVPA